MEVRVAEPLDYERKRVCRRVERERAGCLVYVVMGVMFGFVGLLLFLCAVSAGWFWPFGR